MPRRPILKFMPDFSEYRTFLTFMNRRTGRMAEADRRGNVALFTRKGRVENLEKLKIKRK